jgi:hypothetical protein
MKGFEMMIGSLRHSEHNGSLLHHVHNYDCLSFKLSPKDIHDFITSGSFLLTFLDELQAFIQRQSNPIWPKSQTIFVGERFEK